MFSLYVNVWLLLLVLISDILTMAQVAFPEDVGIDKKKSNIDGRKPLFSPARCKQNELLYPGDQPDDWICDCAPANIYYPETDACYPAFRRGPCKNGEMIVLYKDTIIPECRDNPCKVDGEFLIREKCYQFGSSDPNPCPMKEYSYVLGVDPNSLLVSCVKLSVQLENRFGPDNATTPEEYNVENAKKCARGSRLSVKGSCVA